MNDSERAALVQRLKELAAEYDMAEFSDRPGGASSMRLMSDEALRLLRGHGVRVMSVIGARDLYRWATHFEMGKGPDDKRD